MVEDKYMDLVVTYGEPLITGNSSVLWKTPTLKLSSHTAQVIIALHLQRPHINIITTR